MKQLVRNLLVVAVAFVGSMPVHADATSSGRACEADSRNGSAAVRPAGSGSDLTALSTVCRESRRLTNRFTER